MEKVKGYKVFNSDWSCIPNGNINYKKQYFCPGIFTIEGELKLCKNGMHFCKNLVDCFDYYELDENNKIAEVIGYGEVVTIDNKSCTDKLKIVREILWEEAYDMINNGIKNRGKRNIGNYNIGNYNIGDYNIGYCNRGNWNIGCYNKGDWNCSKANIGCFNTKNNIFLSLDKENSFCFFNKKSNWNLDDWKRSKANSILANMPLLNEFIGIENLFPILIFNDFSITDMVSFWLKDKIKNERTKWWNNLSAIEKQEVLSLPNFDKDIFEIITLIKII